MSTSRFDLDTFERNEQNWSHTDTVEFVDEHSIDKGPVSERPVSGTYDDEFYYATDDEILYRWNGATTEWDEFAFGSDASPTWTGKHSFDGELEIPISDTTANLPNDVRPGAIAFVDDETLRDGDKIQIAMPEVA